MNSNYNKPRGSTPGSLNNFNFDFDLGMGSSKNKSLNDQKNRPATSSFSSYSATPTQPRPAWQPNKPSWTHQPAPVQPTRVGGLEAPVSMVGDIHGKSWVATAPSKSNSGIGIVEKNPNLFGDLVSSALGGNKSSSNVPLKNAAPTSNKSPYSMGNLADSLPKTGNSTKSDGNWGSGESFGSYSGGYNSSSGSNVNVNASANVSVNKSSNLGGPSMKSMGGIGTQANKDPFGSLFDVGLKQSGNLNSASKGSKAGSGDDSFGNFQNASKPSTTTSPSSGFTSINTDFMGSNAGSGFKTGDFGVPSKDNGSKSHPSIQSQNIGGDPLDMFFSSSSASAGGGASASGSGQLFSEVDDWGVDSDFGGGDSGATTTELEGLPPPPAGVTGSAAKNKGIDNQKAGQYPDAIKWLSWAVILLEKSGDEVALKDALSSRASCYKEVGEYKKAVADCSKVLEQDDSNVSVLVQRALLYESMEKYKLGAEDLRTVLKIDPINRVARSTIHRLNKMAE